MSLRKKKIRYPDDPPGSACPHCGEVGQVCSYVNSLSRAWARQACAYKHNPKTKPLS